MDKERFENGSTTQDPMSSGLLISVIRTLTSSVSDDQRQLERSRLEKGYVDSGLVIDRLLKEHEGDVRQCLTSFRKVSNDVTSCRERIHNVKNALLTCKSLLQCRRDDLKKLWMESAEQNHLSRILQQIHDIKHLDKKIEKYVENGNYREAVDVLKKADILLNGPLSQIDGLNQLRTNVLDSTQILFEKIVCDLLQCVVIVPFDCQILELMRNLNEKQVDELPVCVALIDKYSGKLKSTLPSTYATMVAHWANRAEKGRANAAAALDVTSASAASEIAEEAVRNKMTECLESLMVFDQVDSAIKNILNRTTAQCQRIIGDMITILRLFIKDGVGDSTHFAQLCQLLIQQIEGSAFRFNILLEEMQKIRIDPVKNWAHRFWDILQDVLESVVSEHLEIWRGVDGEKGIERQRRNAKTLFSFDNTSFAATANLSLHKKHLNLICPASPYNISVVFHLLNRFAARVEQEIGQDSVCKLSTFLHTFVMDYFIERVRVDLEAKTEKILSGTDVWSSLSSIPSYNMKILTSCLRIFELCEMINGFILKMSAYTQRFASLWLLIIAAFTKSATDMYSQIICTRSHQGERMVEHSKISAAWAVDEDISRLLKSLPSWTNVSQLSQQKSSDITPILTDAIKIEKAEQDVRSRTQRESEILIGNLGTQKQIQRAELITDMEHVKSLACMHESLQWFASRMRDMIAAMPDTARKIIQCRIQISSNESGEMVEKLLSEALEERWSKLENMAETCLLMLYLEIRVHCFYHLLPLARFRTGDASLPQEEQDREVTEFGKDLIQYNHTLSAFVGPIKLKYLFAGLGHLCASIFINSSQYLSKLTENDRKRMCRNIFTVQKGLSQLSGRPETEMTRAQTFFKLVNMDIDQVFALVRESGESYTYLELTYLFSLVVRSHPVLSSQPGALETILNQLRKNLS